MTRKALRKSITGPVVSQRTYKYMGASEGSMRAAGFSEMPQTGQMWQFEDPHDEAFVEPNYELEDEEDAEEDSSMFLSSLGKVSPEKVLAAITEISDKYLSNTESDLIWLMLEGRRPVEISRILHIPECEVVRLRRNCFRKIRTVYTYDYHHDKSGFLKTIVPALRLNQKQARVLTMFFNYYGLRQIAESIGTRPSNIHRSLQMMRRKIHDHLPADSPHRVFLSAFEDFKYLCLVINQDDGQV